MIKAFATNENWVTINGVHVLIGASGKIVKGPAKMLGSTVSDLKAEKMTDSKKAELKKKYGNSKSSGDSKSSKDSKSEETKAKSEEKSNNSEKLQKDKEKLAELYSKGTYSDSMLESVAMDNFGMSKSDVKDIYKMAGGKNTKFNDKMQETQKLFDSTKGSFTSGGERYSYSMDGYYMVIKNSKGTEVASERVGIDMIKSDPLGSARAILHATSANGGNALDVVSMNTGNSTFDKAVSTKSKYPSGITTATQKRLYTKNINEGKSETDAIRIAKGEATFAELEAKNGPAPGSRGKYVGSKPASAQASTGNSTFDKAVTTTRKPVVNKPTSGSSSTPMAKSFNKNSTSVPKGTTVSVSHQDSWGPRGNVSRNVYTLRFPDGSTKNVTKKQASALGFKTW